VKIGKLNYSNTLPLELQAIVKDIDWHKFGWQIKERADYLHIKYYFKRDLLLAMGIKLGEFTQTWECH
jgi:hypothetical protein